MDHHNQIKSESLLSKEEEVFSQYYHILSPQRLASFISLYLK